MLVLNADQEQKQVFNDLIQATGAQVVWDGRFVVLDNRLVLEGLVRSLVLQFDIRQAEVKLVDGLPVDEGEEQEVSVYPGLKELLAVAVYAFGKWGILAGVCIGQDEVQLEQLFREALSKYQIDMEFSKDSIAFYRMGKVITYEEAAAAAMAAAQAAMPGPVLKLPAVSQKQPAAVRDSREAAQRIEKYHARIHVLNRLSHFQKKALVRDIRCDTLLDKEEKEQLYTLIQEHEYTERIQKIEEELADKANANYAHIQKMIEKAGKAGNEELFEKTKLAVEKRLEQLRIEYGTREVRAIMEKVPPYVERAEYKELMEKLAPYGGIGLAEYQEPLRKMRETLEIKEISNLLMQSPKKSRTDYTQLLRRMEERDFARENAAPYVERILDWIGEFDRARLNKLVSNTGAMDFETAASVYDLVRQESFLPQLRAGALAILSARLEAICVAECRILVNELKKSMAGAVKENARQYFYPAEKILGKTARPEDTRLIDNAVSAYAEKKGLFEYPIFMADTSKEGNGRDGMLLTPEHLFYSTRLSSYRIAIGAVKSVYVSAGLLNHKSLVVEEAGGVRHKIPYAVEAEELQDWAGILGQFILRLQERPLSEKLSYDYLEKQNTAYCSRCGCIWDGTMCPECGLRVS